MEYSVRKLNQDDILEILLEHFPEINNVNAPCSRGVILGMPGDNLRFMLILLKLSLMLCHVK